MNAAPRAPVIGSIAWGGALGIAAILLAMTGYTSRDPDSTLYAQLSARMAAAPIREWIVPEWGGLWGLSGLFREHPVGILILPALLARTGFPAQQAALAVGAACSIGAVLMLGRVAAQAVNREEAILVQWVALILPVAFAYRVRANQEYLVLALTLTAIYGTVEARRSQVWSWILVGAVCGVALVKGAFVVFVPIVCGIWALYVVRRSAHGDPRPRHAPDPAVWSRLAAAMAAVIVLTIVYEWLYRRTSGESFLWFYLRKRIAANVSPTPVAAINPLSKLYNLAWYSARVIWFALPGSLVLLWTARRLPRESSEERRAVLGVLLAAGLYVAVMSLGANRAERFIFPVYFLIGGLGAVVAVRRWRAVNRVARTLSGLPDYSLPLAWLVLFALTLVFARELPYIKL